MAICRHWQAGHCRYGNNCRFEHSTARTQYQNQNRFVNPNNMTLLERYGVVPEHIVADLTKERPQWILSAYAPGKQTPDQLFGGPSREQSFEEFRFLYMEAKACGNESQFLASAQDLYQNAERQMEMAVQNSREAAKHVVEGASRHPNRNDICAQGTQGMPFGEFSVERRRALQAPQPQSNPFASNSNGPSAFGTAAQQGSTFGQPSAFVPRPNAFATPAFGQPAQPSAFGQPSRFGQAAQGTNSAFGQAPAQGATFGQTSTLGAKLNPFGTPAFGQPAQPNNQGSTFGQPSQLGHRPNPFANASNSSPFATMGNQNNPNANGAPTPSPFANANPNQTNAFATNAPTQANMAPNPFGQPAQPAANPFGQPQPTFGNPFGQQNQQQQQPQQSGFGQMQPSSNNGFGQAANPVQNTNQPFGQPAPAQGNPFEGVQAPQAQQQPAAKSVSTNGPYPPDSTRHHPPIESYATKRMDGKLSTFKDKPVTYIDNMPVIREFGGKVTRIWFPNGPPPYSADTELPMAQYDEKSRTQWESFASTGVFADDIMPELAPPRECTRWDF